MIRVIRLALLLIAIVLLQTAVFPHLRIDGVVPDLGLVATIAIAYREGPEMGGVFGFCAGLSADLFLSTPLGLSALAWALTGYLVGILQGGLLRSAWWVAPVLGAIGGIVGGALFVLVGSLVGQEQLFALRSVRIVAVSSAYDALLAPLIFPVAGLAVGGGPRSRTAVGGPGW